MNRDSRAVRTAPTEGMGRRRVAPLALVSLVALLALVLASSASAATQRPFKEVFGSAAQPSFGWAGTMAVEVETGNVLVGDHRTNSISRFHADGTPAPFPALGTNTIDGAEANGKPCAEEPTSCDQTPENGILVDIAGTQIAVDESSGPAAGDIYVRQDDFIDIFAADGSYLGQLTENGEREFPAGISGMAVDTTGAVWISWGVLATNKLSKFVPSSNPVVNTDLALELESPDVSGIAVGRGPSSGSIFGVSNREGKVYGLQINKSSGELEYEFGVSSDFQSIAVDPTNGHVLFRTGAEYETSDGSQPVRVSRFIPKKQTVSLAVNGSSEVLVGEGADPSQISVYGAPAVVPDVTIKPASEITGTKATLSGTVDPAGLEVTNCVFEYGQVNSFGFPEYEDEVPCEGAIPTDSSPHPVHATISELEPNGQKYSFRLVAFNANGQEETEGLKLTTAKTVVTEPASAIGQTAATLNGFVRPEGSAYSECFFQYGLSTSTSFEKTVPCSPGAAAIPADFSPHEVKAAISGLQSGKTYRYRLVATNGDLGTLEGEELTFNTFGLPRIGEIQASNADQGSVTLEAKINPSGFGTSYRFEWGPTSAYGNLAPAEFEPFLGSGTEPILVKTKLSGLATGGTYHYRVIATSSRGTVQSPDHVAETLNSCGLPEGRCFELVSRSEAGPVALPGIANASVEMHYQAATGGTGGFAYPVEGAYPDSTKAADVLYRALRGPGDWTSTQLSPPIVAPNERNDINSISSATQFLSNDLSCGFTESSQPLTADASMKLAREQGASNLYRINPDGSYTGVSNLPPENVGSFVGIPNYAVAGASQDCSVVLFRTQFAYPGVPTVAGAGGSRLYEWRDGTLRNAGVVPAPSGEVAVSAVAGGNYGPGADNTANSVSDDGSRIFFTAENPSAVFVREDGEVSRNVSLSQTATPSSGANYQWATADGSKVFFTANAGLTPDGPGGGAPCTVDTGEGCDLYEYDLATEELTDRSLTEAEGGAEVRGFLGAAADGSRVYFASRNQLVPGSGNSRKQNLAAGSYSIYTEEGGTIDFVGTFNRKESQRVLIEVSSAQTSQVSPDGRYLLFESSAAVTGYEADGMIQAYLYDAEGGSQGVTCVSCRQDGQPSQGERYGNPLYQPLTRDAYIANPLHSPQFLTVRGGEPRVFFSSPDPLAPGAVEGQNNIYEWAHDQVFRLVSAAPGTQENPASGAYAVFGGASEDGSDVYLITPETLSWQDGDQRSSAYDARIGGGFPQPPAPPAPCQPGAENSCQAPPQGGPAVPGAASATFNGPGNQKQTQAKKKKKKAHKKKSKAKKKGSGKKTRHANGNGRTGK